MKGAIEDRETSRGHAVITRGYSGLRVGLQEGCPDPLDTRLHSYTGKEFHNYSLNTKCNRNNSSKKHILSVNLLHTCPNTCSGKGTLIPDRILEKQRILGILG